MKTVTVIRTQFVLTRIAALGFVMHRASLAGYVTVGFRVRWTLSRIGMRFMRRIILFLQWKLIRGAITILTFIINSL
jgi:hypothetical protein